MPRRTRRSAYATCYVTNLSDELVVEIFSQLSRTPFAALGLARAASVCKAWRNLVKANEERLWKEVTLNEHGVESLEGGALEAMGFGWRRRCMVLGAASMRDTQFERMNEHYDFFLECLDDRTDENLFPEASTTQKRSTVQLQAHQRMELGGLAGIGFTAKEQFTQTLDPTDVSMYVRRKADGKVALLFSAHITDSVTPDEDNGMIICDVSAVPPNWNLAGIGQDFRFELRQKCSGPLQDDFPAQWIADNPKPPDAIQLGGFAWEYHLEAAGQRACWTAFEFWMLLQAIPDDVRAVMGRWA